MRDNQEMASILFNSNLATADQLNSSWGEITETRDIGRILVDKGILLQKTYEDLLVYIDSLHPENIVIAPDPTPQDDSESFDAKIEAEGSILESNDNSFDINIEADNSILESSESIDPSAVQMDSAIISEDEMESTTDVEASIVEAGSEELTGAQISQEFEHIPEEAFVVDLDDVEPHVDEEDLYDTPKMADPFGTQESADRISDFQMQPEPDNGSKVKSAVDQALGALDNGFREISADDIPDTNFDIEETPGADMAESIMPATIPGAEQVQETASQSASQPATGQAPAAQSVQVKAAEKDSIEPEVTDRLPEKSPESRVMDALTIAIPETITVNNSLDEMLLFARNNTISDLHLIPDAPVTFRRFGSLVTVGEVVLTADMIEEMLLSSLPAKDMEEFHETGDTEFVYSIPGGGRYRVTVMKARNGWSFTARIIPLSIAAFDQIGLSESAYGLTKWAQGLVLVTGPAGCGKSATLSTLIETINSERNEHIITIEDPIETVFPLGQSQITQRQVGKHTLSQDNALRGALRQDPDILMVSELRDMESIQLAVSAAETGHLVFGTMNTTNAMRTINRLVESFPADEQDVIRSMVSESLRGVIAQQLIPRKDGNGVVPCFEVLLVTPAVANMIRKNEMHQLESAMVTGRNQGMILFDDSLMELVKNELITGEEAHSRANDKDKFKMFLGKSEVN